MPFLQEPCHLTNDELPLVVDLKKKILMTLVKQVEDVIIRSELKREKILNIFSMYLAVTNVRLESNLMITKSGSTNCFYLIIIYPKTSNKIFHIKLCFVAFLKIYHHSIYSTCLLNGMALSFTGLGNILINKLRNKYKPPRF